MFGGGASLIDFYSHVEMHVSVRKIRNGTCKKVDELHGEGLEGAKMDGVASNARFSTSGSLFMCAALMDQLGSSHRKLPLDREFLDRIINNNRLFLTIMSCGLWAGDGSTIARSGT